MKNITDLFSSLIRISHMLVAEGNFLSCKLQPVRESLVLFICKKQSREGFILVFFFVSSQCHPYLSKMFLFMLSADKLLTTLFFRLA